MSTPRGKKRKAKEEKKSEPQTYDSTIRELRLPVYIIWQSEDDEDSSAKEDDNPTLGNGMDLPSNNEKSPTGRRKYSIVENNTALTQAVKKEEEEQKGPIKRPKNMAATYSCSECSYTADNFYNLKIHKITHTDMRLYVCPTCNFGFRHKSHLTRHLHRSANCNEKKKHKDSSQSEDDENSSAKEDDNPTLGNGMDLPSNNEKSPTGRRKYSIVENNTALTQAVKKEEEEQEGPIKRPKNMAATYSCSECSYTADNSYNLKIHKITHTDMRPYVCPTCNFGFRHKSHLTRHLHRSANCNEKKKHKDSSTLLKCSSCDYTTSLGYNLKLHQRIHTDERPYECRTCGFKFRTQSHLLRHTRRRTCQPVIKSESSLESPYCH